MTREPDAPASEMAGLEDRQHRAALLGLPRFAPLEAMRVGIEARYGPTPHVDPLDGGTGARCLVLLETPGPRGDPPRFVSRDNPTGTARNLRRFTVEAGLDRRETLLWNAVPWTIHAPGARNRAPRSSEIATGLDLLPALLALLPALRVVVLAGRVAAGAEPSLQATCPTLAVLRMPHPSPTFVATAPSVAMRIVAVLAEAAGMICRSQPSRTLP